MTSLSQLPTALQTVVKNAFRNGVRWSFVSLIPWLGIGCIVSIFLSRIADSDKEGEETEVGQNKEGRNVEHVEMETRTAGRAMAGVEVSAR